MLINPSCYYLGEKDLGNDYAFQELGNLTGNGFYSASDFRQLLPDSRDEPKRDQHGEVCPRVTAVSSPGSGLPTRDLPLSSQPGLGTPRRSFGTPTSLFHPSILGLGDGAS